MGGSNHLRSRSARSNASRGYEQPWRPDALATLVLRPALRSQPNTRSCGNQPAHISLDHASRNDTLTSTLIPSRSSPVPCSPIAATQ